MTSFRCRFKATDDPICDLAKYQILPSLQCLYGKLYTTQSLRVKWSDTTSPQFTVMNGVKPGLVLSPILFAIYTDGLLKRLEDTGVSPM